MAGDHHPRGQRGDQNQPRKQHDAAIAVKQRPIELPDEGRQQPHQAEREQGRGSDGLQVELRVAQAQRLERFDLLRPEYLSLQHDGLPARKGLLDWRHGFACVLLGLRSGLRIHGLVGLHEALHELHDDRAVGIRDQGRHAQRYVAADLVHPVVGNAVLHDVLQDALRFVGDG